MSTANAPLHAVLRFYLTTCFGMDSGLSEMRLDSQESESFPDCQGDKIIRKAAQIREVDYPSKGRRPDGAPLSNSLEKTS